MMMERLGYTCYQKTHFFAQFDSELGVLGKIDFIFVNTQDGKNMIRRSLVVEDELLGKHPVIQLTDYIDGKVKSSYARRANLEE